MAHFWRVPDGKGGFMMVERPTVATDIDLNQAPPSVTIVEKQVYVCDVCKRKFKARGPFASHFNTKHRDLLTSPDSWKSYAGVTH